MKTFPMNITVNVPNENDKGEDGVTRNVYAHGRVLSEDEVAAVVEDTSRDLPDGFRVSDRPVEIVAGLLITDGVEGGNEGTADVAFAPGHVPSEEEMAQTISQVVTQLPNDLRLMTRHEAFLHTLADRTGITEVVALPRLGDGEEWHDPETASISVYQTQPWRARFDQDDDLGFD